MTTTTLQATSINESSQIGEQSNAPLGVSANIICNTPSTPQSVNANIVYLEVNAAKPIPIPNTTSIDDLIKEFEVDPEMAAAISQSRSDLSDHLYAGKPVTLSSVRLSAGMSQSQLAEKISTSQPHIARIESGKTDPSTDVIARLATALDKDESLIFTAIRNQRKLKEDIHE